jgi:F0F1-type ATP synthase membrane subunit b/b'
MTAQETKEKIEKLKKQISDSRAYADTLWEKNDKEGGSYWHEKAREAEKELNELLKIVNEWKAI